MLTFRLCVIDLKVLWFCKYFVHLSYLYQIILSSFIEFLISNFILQTVLNTNVSYFILPNKNSLRLSLSDFLCQPYLTSFTL
jgi:uncharacterized membrane protein